jgi:hypothetical protein
MTPVWVNSEIIRAEKIFSPTDRRSVGRSVGHSPPPTPRTPRASRADDDEDDDDDDVR